MFYGLILIAVGLLAARSITAAKIPGLGPVFDKVAPYQGWVGVAFGIMGIVSTISVILSIKAVVIMPIWWLTMVAVAIVELALGFLLGYDLFAQYVLSKNPEISQKSADLRKTLQGQQTTLGLVAIGLGLWTFVVSFII